MTIKTFITAAAIMTPFVANAAIPYRVQQNTAPAVENARGNDVKSFARNHPFYVGGMYNFSMWAGYTDDADVHWGGKNTSGFDVMVGLRPYDIFRLELNYTRTQAKWGDVTLDGDTGFINAYLDGRIDSMYRLFRSQHLVPYVGVGAGLSRNRADNAHLDKKTSPVLGAMAGLGIELGEHFTIDVGYRYMYMFTPRFAEIDNLAPTAHQLRAGARINF